MTAPTHVALVYLCPACGRRHTLEVRVYDGKAPQRELIIDHSCACGVKNRKVELKFNREMIVVTRGPDSCTGCNCPLELCGPELWAKQKKCCPDCSHGAQA